jgi:NAD(P)-dependent dehydrogenase (short-subunit alcohol dehydrogenase family)
MLVAGDVAEAGDVRRAIDETRARYGGLNGVVHAAGITNGPSIFQPFESLTEAHIEEQLRPKMLGARVLAEELADEALDFVLLISSNASVLGGLGLAAYAAANCFLDVFAAERAREHRVPWISAGWDGWPTARRTAIDGAWATAADRFAMTVEECETALRLVLAAPAGHVVVSSADMTARLERWTALADDVAPSAEIPLAEDDSQAQDEITRTLIALWREMLGTGRLGVYDNFFELRGDSLLGSRMITRLNMLLGVQLPLRTLFEKPTIAGLTERVAAFRNRTRSPLRADEVEMVL